MGSVSRRAFKFLASLKLAVVLLLSLAAILGTATYYEAKYDAKTASHLVYGSWWFYLFLFMLCVNVTCAAAIRYPWKRHQVGFVVTHLGIIVILVGSFITALAGLEGTLALADGDKGHVITIDRPTISYQIVDGKQGHGAELSQVPVRQIPAEFRWNPPGDGQEHRFDLVNGMVVVVDRYFHHAMPETRYEDGGPAENPAVQFRINSSRVHVEEWLALADPDRQQLKLGPATVRLMKAASNTELKRLLQARPQPSNGSAGFLIFDVGGKRPVVPVAGSIPRLVALPGTPYRVRIDRYLPYAIVENNQLVNRSPQRVNPAVEFVVLDDQGEAEKHIAFARFPEFSTTHHQKRQTRLRVSYAFDNPVEGNGIDLVLAPHGKLLYVIHSARGAVRSGEALVGLDVPTGWMDLAFAVERFVPRAHVIRQFRDFRPARGKEGPPPAIRVRVVGADDPGPYWLQQGDEVVVGRGRQAVRLAYHLQGVEMGFALQLKHFEVGYDPGTKNAASYASDVHVDDPSHSASFDYHISMNDPLHYSGLTFFQASFQEEGGRPIISILQVARDPGVPVKYAGSILLVCGIAIMFFIKPFPKKREAAGNGRSRSRLASTPHSLESEKAGVPPREPEEGALAVARGESFR